MTKKRKYVFGVFYKGNLVLQVGNNLICNDETAKTIVALLDMAKHVLAEGHYFACDYYENVYKTNKI